MNLNINDKAWFIRRPRFTTFANAVMVILAATACGIIAEWILQMSFDIAHLGIWSIFAVAGSSIAAVVRIHAVVIAIALANEPVTIHDEQEQEYTQSIEQNTPLEKGADSISKAFSPITYIITIGTLTATSILITQHHHDIAEQITPTWVKSYPISLAAAASAAGIALTNTTTVEQLIGKGRLRLWAIRFGKLAAIATAIGILAAVVTGIIIFISRIS